MTVNRNRIAIVVMIWMVQQKLALAFLGIASVKGSFYLSRQRLSLPPRSHFKNNGEKQRTTCFLSSDSSTPTKKLTSNEKKKMRGKLSRPERKTLERKRKEEKKLNKKRRKPKKKRPNGEEEEEGRYLLHSTAIPCLTLNSTAEEVTRAIKRSQKNHDVHDLLNIERFLLEEVPVSFAYGYRGSLLARLAVAAMHMNEHELARKALEERRAEHRSSMLPLESAAVVRGLLRMHNVSDAMMILEDELSLPLEGTPLDTMENKDRIKHRALAIGSIASRHFFEDEPVMAVKACQMLAQLRSAVKEARLTAEDLNMPWLRIVQGAAQCESRRRDKAISIEDASLPCNLVYAVLNAIAAFPSDNDDRLYEALSNALVRRTVFITGATSMSTLPAPDRGEAVFIGRSNVGKSSLVNMITNRKSLAYTSKNPGKTQQFNYFSINDKPEKVREVKYGDDVPGDKDRDSFYMVDLPGFGFAKVPQHQRQLWSDFLDEYLQKRDTLRVVFHLVDARHGPTPEDERIMTQIGRFLPKRVKYLVVLTKADKNVKNRHKRMGTVSEDVLEKLRQVMQRAGVEGAPVVLTSAETKLGRDEVWRYLRTAAEFESDNNF